MWVQEIVILVLAFSANSLLTDVVVQRRRFDTWFQCNLVPAVGPTGYYSVSATCVFSPFGPQGHLETYVCDGSRQPRLQDSVIIFLTVFRRTRGRLRCRRRGRRRGGSRRVAAAPGASRHSSSTTLRAARTPLPAIRPSLHTCPGFDPDRNPSARQNGRSTASAHGSARGGWSAPEGVTDRPRAGQSSRTASISSSSTTSPSQ